MVDKIIFTVTPIFSIPPRGAAAIETWIYQVAQRTRIPNRVTCIKNKGYKNMSRINDHCSVHRIGFSRLYKRLFQKWTRLDPLPYSQRILNIAKDFNVTDDSVIIVHNSIKLYRQIRKRAPHAKMVMHMHNAFEPDGLAQDVKMIVPSLFLKKHYQEYLPNADIAIVPNGIDPDAYAVHPAVSKHKKDLKPHHQSDGKTIFYAGRISPDKGVLPLLKAFEKLRKTNKKLKLVIVGDYLKKSKGEKEEYIKQVRKIAERLKPHCHMLGETSPELIYHYYSLADLVVIPSQVQEAFCMVAIEAMGAGKPVLVSTRGAMVEFVKKNITGFHLQEPMTPETIAYDIGYALQSPDLRLIAMRGKSFVLKNFPWESVTRRFEEVITNWFPDTTTNIKTTNNL
ncbi:TPA: lipopolysaccharide N-acetylglucosaminyltransferase [Salmonella enterica subsp. salamae serovar [1],40:z35:e,n,x,z15]|nr:lipopolysaccharide N-acetylglucosaminyltransferase [Salmonella enterica]HCM2000517.1 lipopolysaccharide N-acetylglucosaminyltransferase [Salmonella enterica subsp. salamae serovar [1],40:z35:e,n,x,z15]